MPHCEIHYTADIKLDVELLFEAIESMINTVDPTAGACKSRAYQATQYKHSHVMINIWLLPKIHRDEKFSRMLLHNLEEYIQSKVASHCFVSLQLYYRDGNYLTRE